MKRLFALFAIMALTFQTTHAGPPVTIKQSYDSQIGVREATGHNDGPAVEMYLRTVNLPKGFAWCAAFVKWNLLNAGITSAYQINAMALSAENKDHIIYKAGHFFLQPRPGDVGTLYYARLHRIGHTFFYDASVNTKIYRSVEGNTNEAGSREGDGVYRKYRSYNSTYSISRWNWQT